MIRYCHEPRQITKTDKREQKRTPRNTETRLMTGWACILDQWRKEGPFSKKKKKNHRLIFVFIEKNETWSLPHGLLKTQFHVALRLHDSPLSSKSCFCFLFYIYDLEVESDLRNIRATKYICHKGKKYIWLYFIRNFNSPKHTEIMWKFKP